MTRHHKLSRKKRGLKDARPRKGNPHDSPEKEKALVLLAHIKGAVEQKKSAVFDRRRKQEVGGGLRKKKEKSLVQKKFECTH